jgi:hypothetical protein
MTRFPPRITKEIEETKYMRIRSGDHRYIHIWVVVVDGRIVVRSWNDNPEGWYRAFLAEPRGAIQLGGKDVPVRATRVRSAKLNDAADDAYGEKYTTKANRKYVEGFAERGRKAHTLELVPG